MCVWLKRMWFVSFVIRYCVCIDVLISHFKARKTFYTLSTSVSRLLSCCTQMTTQHKQPTPPSPLAPLFPHPTAHSHVRDPLFLRFVLHFSHRSTLCNASRRGCQGEVGRKTAGKMAGVGWEMRAKNSRLATRGRWTPVQLSTTNVRCCHCQIILVSISIRNQSRCF